MAGSIDQQKPGRGWSERSEIEPSSGSCTSRFIFVTIPGTLVGCDSPSYNDDSRFRVPFHRILACVRDITGFRLVEDLVGVRGW